MIKYFAITMLSIVFTIAIFAQNPSVKISQTEKSKNEVLTIAKQLATAIYVNYDVKVAEIYLANEYTEPSAFYIEIQSLGAKTLKSARNKADVITNLKPSENVPNPGKSFIESVDFEEADVEIYGKTALVTARIVMTGKSDGFTQVYPFVEKSQYTGVFVKKENRWQAVRIHLSQIEHLAKPAI